MTLPSESQWTFVLGGPPTFVYFVRDSATDLIKIGVSADVQERMQGVKYEAKNHPITLLAAARGNRKTEYRLHKLFADDRAHGEWFHSSPPLEALIEFVNEFQGLPTRSRRVAHLEGAALQGENQSVANARKTECLHGHAFTPANTYTTKVGGRMCRACTRERVTRVRAAKRQQKAAS